MENINIPEKTFMAESIKCEILPRGNKRTMEFPAGHYAIVGDAVINGKDYEWADTYEDSVPFEESKRIFSESAVVAFERARKNAKV